MEGIFIPNWVCNIRNLSLIDKVVLSIFSKDGESRISNSDLANLCGCTKRTITSSVARLAEQNLIEIVSIDGVQRVVRSKR